MAVVSGRVLFDRNRTASSASSTEGIANVPVVLQNVVTNARLSVYTNSNGEYSFINVPNGSYRVVESFGTPAVNTPGDFNNAVVGGVPIGAMPPINYVSNPPTGSTNLDATTPNTVFITVNGANISNVDFLNGPVRYTPISTITDNCVTISPINLINVADNGTFGTFPAGTAPNTGANPNLYPGIAPDFTYVLPDPDNYTPDAGEYTIQNLMNNSLSNRIGAWWRIADHTEGNETGRMMVVNGFEPGSIFFRDVVTVKPNTNYLFSSWILNMFKALGYANPQLGVEILDENGNVIFHETLGALIPVNTNTPEWKQIGTIINSQNNNTLTVEFLSEGPEAIGNDYAIDDISLNEIEVPIFTPIKTVSDTEVGLGDIVTFTVTLTNTCESPLTNVIFQDIIPEGLTFLPNSVIVNGTSEPGLNPNIGFSIPDIEGGETATISFSATATSIPTENPVINRANISYDYTPVEGGIPETFNVMSNEVEVEIEEVVQEADISVVKTANSSNVNPGDMIEYRIVINNLGPSASENVILTDNISPNILNPEFSIDGGNNFYPWQGTFNFGTIEPGDSQLLLIRGTVSENSSGRISNTATVSSLTPDPNLANNTSTVTVNVTASSRCQAITDIIESVALQETALSHILNAEGEKIQTAIAIDDITPEQLLKVNQSATDLVNTITKLELILQSKLQLFSGECNQD